MAALLVTNRIGRLSEATTSHVPEPLSSVPGAGRPYSSACRGRAAAAAARART